MNYRALASKLSLILTLAPLLHGQQQFAERESPYMPHVRSPGRSVAAADVNGDGHPDLVVANNAVTSGWQNHLYLGDGQGAYQNATATHLPQGAHRSSGVAVGDVDGDGDIDFVTANAYQNRIYLNNGQGVFAEATFGRMPVDQSNCRAVALRDLDGDGDLDLVFAAYRQELLYLNDGTGVFVDVTGSHMVADATSTWDLAVADIDGDGDLDLVTGEQNGYRLLLNDGTAHFADVTALRLPTASSLCQAVGFGDLDGDGDLDLACGFWSAPPGLYFNNGSGTFTKGAANQLVSGLDSVLSVSIGDVDGDLDSDLILAGTRDRLTPALELHRNSGAGAFVDSSSTHLLTNASAYVAKTVLVDADADQDLDLVAVAYGQRDLLMRNDGDGVLVDVTASRLYSLSDVPGDAVLADLDGDGDRDLVFANVYFEFQSWPNRLHRNDGRGNFTDVTGTHMPPDNNESRAVVCGDIDKDGDLDLIFGNFGEQNSLYLNDGAANFTDATLGRMPAALDATTSLAVGDVNADGYVDLVAGNFGEPVRLCLNDKAGGFVDVTLANMPATTWETRALELGDVDNDGDLDLMLAVGLVYAGQNVLLLNDGLGGFTDVSATQMPNVRNTSACIALGDLDGDGDLDAVFGNDARAGGATNLWYRNDGAGNFIARGLVYDLDSTRSVALMDADEDGDLDVVLGNYDFYNKIALNDGAGGFRGAPSRMPGVLENTRALVAGDIDGDGDCDLVAGNSGASRLESSVYVNHLRQVSASRIARVGANWTVDVSSQAGFAQQQQAALVFLSLAPASISLPPYGRLGLDPGQLVILPGVSLAAPGGMGSVSVPIPPVPGLVGLDLFVQAGVQPTANPADARLTNVLRARINGF